VVEHSDRKLAALLDSDVEAPEVQAGLVHADQPNGGEVVMPVLPELFPDTPQIELRVRTKTAVGKLFQGFPFGFQASLGKSHQSIEAAEEIPLSLGLKPQPRHVDSDQADRAGERVGPERPATTPL